MSIEWVQVEGGGVHVTAGGGQQLYVCNGEGNIFTKGMTTEWAQIEGKLTQIAVGGANSSVVVGVNEDGNIFRRDGAHGTGSLANDLESLVGGGWTQVDGGLKHVSVGGDGCLWGVNGDNQIWYSPSAHEVAWQHIEDGELMQICVDRLTGQVVGVNEENIIWKRTGISPENPVGDGWEQVDGALKYVSSCGNSIMGVNADDAIWFMRAGTDEWVSLGGALSQVDLCPSGVAVGCNSEGNLFQGYVV